MILEIIYRIQQETIRAGFPEPFYKQMGAGFALVFEQEKGAAYFEYSKHEEENNIGKDTIKDTIKDTLNTLTENERKIIEIIGANPNVTTENLSEMVGINLRNIKKNIKKLKEKELLMREGSKKAGKWIINTRE